MASKLKELQITSVDFVERGANPDAYLCLFKGVPKKEEGGGVNANMYEDFKEEGTYFKSSQRLLQEMEHWEVLHGGDSVVKGGVSALRNAFEELEALKKSQEEEIYNLKKGMELERLELFCKKFQQLGKDPKALAEHLYRLQSFGADVYEEFVQILEESLGFFQQSGILGEIGATGSGSSSESVLTGQAKGFGGYSPASLVETWEKNPDMAAKYEADYRKGRFV